MMPASPRDRPVGERTALINQLRAVLLERGIVMPQGRRKLERHVDALLAEEEIRFSPRARLLIACRVARTGPPYLGLR